MAAFHPAVVWLVVAAVVGAVLFIASFVANRNEKKKKKGEFVVKFGFVFEKNYTMKGISHIKLSYIVFGIRSY